MRDLEIATIKLYPDHPSGQGGDFEASKCKDMKLTTACQPVAGSKKSSLLIELGSDCTEPSQGCQVFDIKSVTIYTPTIDVPRYQADYHNIKVG